MTEKVKLGKELGECFLAAEGDKLHLTWGPKPNDFCEVFHYPTAFGPCESGEEWVLLKWAPDPSYADMGPPYDETTCVLAEYFPTFEAAVRRLVELEGKGHGP